MRISDWSSDVCSSDLRLTCRSVALGLHEGDRSHQAEDPHDDRCVAQRVRLGHRFAIRPFAIGDMPVVAVETLGRTAREEGEGDVLRERKRVGWGKRGSVSVDLGGRRIIKKKKKTRKMTEDRKASKIWKHQSRNCKSDRAREN